jgi:hypothetical protein
MLQPVDASRRSVTNSRSTACGVSTEVGSSRISSRGSVSSARTISTRCRSPTDSVCTGRAGSSSSPYSPAFSRIRADTSASDSEGSTPSQTFSATLTVSNRLKCWNTIEMPSRRASCGLRISTGRPSTRIPPASGRTAP